MDSRRKLISGFRRCTALPKKGVEGEPYLLLSGDSASIYIWDDKSNSYICVGSDSSDIHILTNITESVMYLVGVKSDEDGSVSTGTVNPSVYVTFEDGKSIVHSDKFSGTVDHADYADTAGTALSADSVSKLGDKSVGNQDHPIYLKDGNPVETAHVLEQDVTIDSKLTDTTYEPFIGSTYEYDGSEGLVPAPSKDDIGKYLGSDGRWSAIDVMVGSTDDFGDVQGEDGKPGFVPEPKRNQSGYVLTGSGACVEVKSGDCIEVSDDLTIGVEDREIDYSEASEDIHANSDDVIPVHNIQYDSKGMILSDTLTNYSIKAILEDGQDGSTTVLQKYFDTDSYIMGDSEDDEDVEESEYDIRLPIIFSNQSLVDDGISVIDSVQACEDISIDPINGTIYAERFSGSVENAEYADSSLRSEYAMALSMSVIRNQDDLDELNSRYSQDE